jgi:hypothetical protein
LFVYTNNERLLSNPKIFARTKQAFNYQWWEARATKFLELKHMAI